MARSATWATISNVPVHAASWIASSVRTAAMSSSPTAYTSVDTAIQSGW